MITKNTMCDWRGGKRMNFISNCIGVLVIVYFVSIPFMWAWVFYHKIKCRKKEDCSNRKCKYWEYCEHNYVERKKELLELRKQMLLHNLGLTEEELDEKYS